MVCAGSPTEKVVDAFQLLAAKTINLDEGFVFVVCRPNVVDKRSQRTLSLGISLTTHPSLVFLIGLLFIHQKASQKSPTSSIPSWFHFCVAAARGWMVGRNILLSRDGKDDFIEEKCVALTVVTSWLQNLLAANILLTVEGFFCQQTPQINIHCFGGGTLPVHLAIWKWRSIIARADGAFQLSSFQFDIPWAALHPTLLRYFHFPSPAKSTQWVTEESGWCFPECSIRDHCGQCQMRSDRLCWEGSTGIGGFTNLCPELCYSKVSVRRVWETISSGVCLRYCPEKFVESRFDRVLLWESADTGRKLLRALLPCHHREELAEQAPHMPRCLPPGWLQRQWKQGCLRNVRSRGGSVCAGWREALLVH